MRTRNFESFQNIRNINDDRLQIRVLGGGGGRGARMVNHEGSAVVLAISNDRVRVREKPKGPLSINICFRERFY